MVDRGKRIIGETFSDTVYFIVVGRYKTVSIIILFGVFELFHNKIRLYTLKKKDSIAS